LKWDGKQTNDDVRQSQICDEKVGRRSHPSGDLKNSQNTQVECAGKRKHCFDSQFFVPYIDDQKAFWGF